jgi:hypothetical protein
LSDGYVAAIQTPWGQASELRNRKLHPGSGTPRPEVIRNQREALLAVADQLSIELGYTEDEEVPGASSQMGKEGAMVGLLNSEDELLVTRMRRGLAKVAVALGVGVSDGVTDRAVGVALDGAEIVRRGELVSGNATQLPALMPSFVFLVALPVVDQARALALSRRTERLVEGALAG